MPPPAPPAASITLVRHGRSAHPYSGWHDTEGLRRWRAGYDAASLRDDDRPPAALVARAEAAACLVTSDVRRARRSMELVAPSRTDVLVSPLLREIEFETQHAALPTLGGARLPLLAWAFLFFARGYLARLRGVHPPGVDDGVLARAAEAAAWLEQRAAAHGTVLVVTHASFRGLLAAALVARGWRGPDRRPWREWSAWELTHPHPDTAAPGAP